MLQNIGGFCFLQLAVVYSVSTKEIGLEGLEGHSAYLQGDQDFELYSR